MVQLSDSDNSSKPAVPALPELLAVVGEMPKRASAGAGNTVEVVVLFLLLELELLKKLLLAALADDSSPIA